MIVEIVRDSLEINNVILEIEKRRYNYTFLLEGLEEPKEIEEIEVKAFIKSEHFDIMYEIA